MKAWVGALTITSLAFAVSCTGADTGEAGMAVEAEATAAEDTAAETAAAETTAAEAAPDEASTEATPTSCGGGTSNTVVMSTSMGDITIELFPEQAPITVENFLAYVESCFYDDVLIHRVSAGFVLQGGGYSTGMQRKDTRPPITNEADNGLFNERGTLSMARTPDVNSATSQFFINLVDNTVLNHGVRDFGYAVFARVIEGMDVVDAMAQVPVRGERPEEEIVIRSMRRQ